MTLVSLRFIYGRAGSGKTHRCLEEIRQALRHSQEGPALILLVPEQATFQMEYALATTPELEGIMRAQVLSFRRLGWRVLLETGGAARVPIGELGKRMVLRRLLDQHQGELRVFGRSAGQHGFADCLARAIGELKTYRINPDGLAEATGSFSGSRQLLGDKLADLQLLYQELENFLSTRYTDPDDYLNLLADRLHRSPTVQDAEIWVDGFTGFTPQEFAVLKGMLETARRVNVTLCLDSARLVDGLEEDDLFYPPWETMVQINRLAKEIGVPVEEPVILGETPLAGGKTLLGDKLSLGETTPFRFRHNAALAHLEKFYYRYPAEAFTGEVHGLTIAAGANRRAEVEAAAREIIRLCRDEGFRWREVAVIQRDLENYQELIVTVFSDYGIPFFIDRKRPVMHHPLIELIRSVLETALRDWSYEPVFRYLKTDLATVSRGKVDILENYILAHGIRGSRWTDETDWTYRRRYTLGEDTEVSVKEAAELAVINKTRRRAAADLLEFTKRVKGAKTAREFTTALCDLLKDLKVARKLERWSAAAEKAGQLEKAREHVQIWGSVLGLLDEVVEVLGEEELTLETYQAVLDAGLESLRLGLIPPGLDQVLVGSVDRSRNPSHVRAVFLLGASDGVLPARPGFDGIFNDKERELLETAGVKLAPGGRRRAFDEQFLVYTALTRAGEKLWVSYPLTDDEGRAIAPSQVITRLKELMPQVKEKICLVEPVGSDAISRQAAQGTGRETEQAIESRDFEFIVNPNRTLGYLASRLREVKAGRSIDPVWFAVYNWFMGDAGRKEQAGTVLQGLFQLNREKPVSRENSRRLYGQPLRAGVSRIEKFRSCPFAHFANYGLRLKERAMFRLAAPDMGEFFHAALKGFAERLREESLDWGQLSPEACIRLSGEVVEGLVPQLQSEILLSTKRLRYLTRKLKQIVDRAVLVLAEHARRSSFRPVGLELSFGSEGGLPPVTIKLADGTDLELNGRIDRVDLAETPEGAYLRVIDYKSGENKVSLPEIYHGFRLQLLTYLHVALTHSAILAGREGLPGGIFYFMVKDPTISHKGPLTRELVEQAVLKKLKMRGLLLADTEVFRMMDNQVENGTSALVPAGLKKDGTFRSDSQVITAEQFQLLRKHLEGLLAESGEAILGGEAGIVPFRDKAGSACRFCPFRPVCRFDLQLTENRYRSVPKLSADSIWGILGNQGVGE